MGRTHNLKFSLLNTLDFKQPRFRAKNLKPDRVDKLSEGQMAGNIPRLVEDMNPQTFTEPSAQLKCPGEYFSGRTACQARKLEGFTAYKMVAFVILGRTGKQHQDRQKKQRKC